jgi:hypothetical protein
MAQGTGYNPAVALSSLDAAVRAAINEGFLERGSAPTAEELAHQLAVDRDAVYETLRRLAGHGSIALRPATMDLWTAPPFSATPTLHRVEVAGRSLWGGCAWCALGICALAGAPGKIRTVLGGDGEVLTLDVGVDGPVSPKPLLVHFAVPARRWSESLAYACSTILLFEDEEAVAEWCARRRLPAGRTVPLDQVWRLAVAWFGGARHPAPHLRHRSDLEAVFRSVGLDDDFFALKDRAPL